jgi:hypothetical protein
LTLAANPSSAWTVEGILSSYHDQYGDQCLSTQDRSLAREIAASSSCGAGAATILKLYKVVRTNAFLLQRVGDGSSSAGFFPHMMFANHSCDYNALFKVESSSLGALVLVFYARRAIQKWEEVTITYYPEVRVLNVDTNVSTVTPINELSVDQRRHTHARTREPCTPAISPPVCT